MFLKEFFEKVNFEKSADDKKSIKLTQHAELRNQSDLYLHGLHSSTVDSEILGRVLLLGITLKDISVTCKIRN